MSSKRRTALHFAAGFSHLDIVKYLIEQGLDPNEKDFVGNTPLMYCLRRGGPDDSETVETLRYLLENGAKIDDSDFVRAELKKYESLKDLIELPK